jgi:hypothetical protein|tara:strand:+ start:7936 stop:8331 length:396 start_codon:yes stop_codon:yes gene_type:complete
MKNKHKIITDPYKIRADKFSMFTKAVMIAVAQGDTFYAFIMRFQKLGTYIRNKDEVNGERELQNLISNIFAMYEEHDLDSNALKYLVVFNDESDEVKYVDEEKAYHWLNENHTKEELINISNEVKKKFIEN